jgi:hypothetical protein
VIVDEWHEGLAFGDVLAGNAPTKGGLIVVSAGAVPLLTLGDARRLVRAASSQRLIALSNNRYSSDVCAVAEASTLRRLPPLPSDNALPRWLEEHAGYQVGELPGRRRLAVDLDTPLDVAIAGLVPRGARWLARAAREHDWRVPRLDDVRRLVADPHAELVVFGRSSSSTLRWLERNVRCRVRFMAEERGLRASSPLAIGDAEPKDPVQRRGPRASLGLLLDERGPGALAGIVGELGDGAIIDSRVLLAHRLGTDERDWPSAADRFASDLHRPAEIADPWLRELTQSVADADLPILLGGHSLVGPGVPTLLGRQA